MRTLRIYSSSADLTSSFGMWHHLLSLTGMIQVNKLAATIFNYCLIFAIIMTCSIVVGSRKAQAATLNVTAGAVDTTTNGNCSLFEAVSSANTDAVVDACSAGSGDDSINIPNGSYDLSVNSVLLSLNSSIDLIGQSRDGTIFTGTGGYGVGLYPIAPSSYHIKNITFESALITGNDEDTIGVSIDNILMYGDGSSISVGNDSSTELGEFELTNSIIRDIDYSGVIVQANYFDTTTISNTQIYNTTSTSDERTLRLYGVDVTMQDVDIYNNGGGIEVQAHQAIVEEVNARDNTVFSMQIGHGSTPRTTDLEIIINKLAVVGNNGWTALWLWTDGASSFALDMKNSTIANNTIIGGSTTVYVGIRENSIPVSGAMRNITIANNTSPGLGHYNGSNPTSPLTLQNVLLSNNTNIGTDENCAQDNGDYYFTFTNLGNNLSDDTSCNAVFTNPSDKNNIPALLGLLEQDGTTWLIPLLSNSPAINAGAIAPGVTDDQRGVVRPQGRAYDIGAYESESSSADTPQNTSNPASANLLAATGLDTRQFLLAALSLMVLSCLLVLRIRSE